METFIMENEICERSLRRRASNAGCTLRRNGDMYTIMQGSLPMVENVTDDECWAVLDNM